MLSKHADASPRVSNGQKQPSIRDLFSKFREKNLSGILLTAEDRKFLVETIESGQMTAAQIHKHYQIPKGALYRFMRNNKEGKELAGNAGRAPTLDSKAQEDFSTFLKKTNKTSQVHTSKESKEKYLELARESCRRRGQSDLRVQVCDTTYTGWLKELDARKGYGQTKTGARLQAERDPRNALCEALLFAAFLPGIPPELIMNIDDTQYGLRNDNEGKQQLVWISDSESDEECEKTPPTIQSSNSGDMGFAIKCRVLISADGFFGPMVLIIADSSIPKGTLKVYQVKGLSHNKDPFASGWIVYMSSRNTCLEFHQWYITTVLCPFVNKIRDFNGFEDTMAFVSQDGEQKGIEAILLPAMVKDLTQSKIWAAKHSASYRYRPLHMLKCHLTLICVLSVPQMSIFTSRVPSYVHLIDATILIIR